MLELTLYRVICEIPCSFIDFEVTDYLTLLLFVRRGIVVISLHQIFADLFLVFMFDFPTYLSLEGRYESLVEVRALDGEGASVGEHEQWKVENMGLSDRLEIK